MKITAIKVQAKKKDRYSIFVDERYSFSLSEYQLAGAGLRIGLELDQSSLDKLKDDSDFGKAYERTLNYIMIRPRSGKEIRDYLTRTFMYPKPRVITDRDGGKKLIPKTVDKTKVQVMIDRILARLDEKGYIDDKAFAVSWVNSRLLTKKLSVKKLRLELLSKGIRSETIDEALDSAEIDESNTLQSLIIKKRRQVRYRDDQKLLQYLLRQGFKYDEIKAEMSKSDL